MHFRSSASGHALKNRNSQASRLILSAAAGAMLALPALGTDLTWQGVGSADFNAASNWNPAQAPTAGDLLIFDNNMNGTAQLTAGATVQALSFRNTTGTLGINLGVQTLNSTTFNVSTNAAHVNDVIFSNGTFVHSATFVLGFNGSSGNRLTFSGHNTVGLSASTGTHVVGPAGSNDNELLITNGAYYEPRGNITVSAAGGPTNNRLTIENARMSIIGGNRGVTINHGTLTVDDAYAQLGFLNALTANSHVAFNSGTLGLRRATIANGLPFTVGDGGSVPATYALVYSGPTASFANGLVLNSNGRLVGGGNPAAGATNGLITGDVSGVAGAKVKPSVISQPFTSADDLRTGTISVSGNWNNNGIAVSLDMGDFPTNIANPPVTPGLANGALLISGAFTHGGSVEIDLFGYIPPSNQDYTIKILGFGSEVGVNSSTPVSFVNGSTPLTTQWQADGLYVTAAQTILPNTTWTFDGSGTWTEPLNWDNGVPNGVDSNATFSSNLTGAATVTLDAAPTVVGRLSMRGTNSYTLEGGTLTMDVSAIGTARISAREGTHTISSPIDLMDITALEAIVTVAGATVTSTGTLEITNTINGGTNNLHKIGAGLARVSKLDVAKLSVDNGTLELRANGTASGVAETTGVSVDDFSRLDLKDNGVVVDYTSTDPSAEIRRAIKIGRAGGFWNGYGIISSDAMSDSSLGVGYARTADTGASTAFETINVDSTTVVIRTTYNGDNDLDGKVNTVDFNYFAGGFGSVNPDWIDGDYDYDGDVDSVDFNAFAGNYGKALPNAAPTLGAVVPEPTLLGLMAFAPLALRRRRA